MKNFAITFIFYCTILNTHAQEKVIINPAKNWYYGAEIGISPDTNNSPTIKILTEYYVFKNWSLTTGLKYHKASLDFYQEGYSSSSSGMGFFNWSSPTYHGNFKGEVLTIPLAIKWEFKFIKKLKGFIAMGVTYSYETKSTYTNYSTNLNPDNYRTNYFGSTLSSGFTYFINTKTALIFSYEGIIGTQKGQRSRGFLNNSGEIAVSSGSINIGLKKQF